MNWLFRNKIVYICSIVIHITTHASTTDTVKDVPIVLVHGILSDAYGMKPTEEYIQKYFPGRYVKSVNIGSGILTSFCNMYDQVNYLTAEIQDDPHLANGFIIIAHSQGGLVSRYFIQRYNTPHCIRYISWGSPQCGVCGTPSKIDDHLTWLNYLEQYVYKFLYSKIFQQQVSLAGYWHDTLHHDAYLKKCQFLPYLNNEIDHTYQQQFKENICSLEYMVLVNSTQEDIIEPVASCHFGYYKKGSLSDVEDFLHSDQYTKDLIGLKTLYDQDRLILKMAHCTHAQYQEDEANFVQNTLPYLQ